jgi:hypothetical protein
MNPLEQRLAAARQPASPDSADLLAAAYEAGRRAGVASSQPPIRLWRTAAAVAAAALLGLGITFVVPRDAPAVVSQQPAPPAFESAAPSTPTASAPPPPDSLLALRAAILEPSDRSILDRLPAFTTGYRGPILTASGHVAG